MKKFRGNINFSWGRSMENKYDYKNKESIEQYGRKLVDKSLSNLSDEYKNNRFNNEKSKGKLGQVIEENYFGYKVNSKQEADFKDAGIELKVCPIKIVKKKKAPKSLREELGYSAKERMVLSIIDFMKLDKESWETNSIMDKCREFLLMFYIHEKDIPKEELVFKLINLWSPSKEDLKIIERDWNVIADKVKAGKAHEISEGDTMYLGACTKGSTAEKSKRKQPHSDIMAPQRAFSYKRNYVDFIIEELLQREANRKVKQSKKLSDEDMLFDDKIYKVFNSMIGLDVKEIMDKYEIKRERKAKDFLSLVMRDVGKEAFGEKLENFEEFKKANIEIKTIVVSPSGMPKESMSFEQIDFCEIVNEEWETSTIKEKFENKKHLWIILKSKCTFKKQSEVSLEDIILHRVMFWNMPINDLESSMYKVWEDTTNKIRSGVYNNFIKISDNEIAHIRPKATTQNPYMITPQGNQEKKKCFWLNASYIKEQIERY